MRVSLIPAALLSLIYFGWNISTRSFKINYGWAPDWGYLFLQLLYWPAVLLAWGVGICAVILLFQRSGRGGAILALVLALPMMGYSLYYPEYSTLKKRNADDSMKEEWFQGSQLLSHLLQKYVRDHRESITWVGGDEQIDPSGFIAYLKTYPKLFYYSYERKRGRIRVSDKEVLSPWGAPLLFGVDRDGDGYLNLGGKKTSLKSGYADPWADGNFSYKVGVGCVPTTIPEAIFEPGATYVGVLDDGQFARLYDYRERLLGN